MKGRNVLRAMLVMALLAMVFAVSANADAPVHPWHTKYILTDDFPVDICDVTMDGHLESKVEYVIYCDRNDTCRGDNYHLNEYLTLTYEDRSFTMHSTGLFGCTWIPTGDTYDQICRNSGGRLIGTLPGYGVVSGWVGREDWIDKGCYDGEDGEIHCETSEYLHDSIVGFWDLEPICNYMLTGE